MGFRISVGFRGFHGDFRGQCTRFRVVADPSCVYVSVCPAPRVLPLRATERPTERRLRRNLGNTLIKCGVSLKILCSKVMA